jgi:protease I
MRALIMSSDDFEDGELAGPLRQLGARGVEVDLAAPQKGPITGRHGHKVRNCLALNAVRTEDYEILILPGGNAPARLRNIPIAVAIALHFLQANKTVGAIGHGVQILIATGLLAGRSLTCDHSIRQELEAAGAHWEDSEVVIDGNLLSSRHPGDIPAFTEAIFRTTGLV